MAFNFRKSAPALLLMALLMPSCTSNNLPGDPDNPSGEPIALRLGQIEVATGATISKTASDTFSDGATILVRATPDGSGTARSATYVYNKDAGWMPDGQPIYYNDVARAHSFSGEMGDEALVVDQSTADAFTRADRITGPLVIDDTASAPVLTTADTPMEHANIQFVVSLSRGTGWTDAEWQRAVSNFNFTYLTATPDLTVAPFADATGLRFSARMPSADIPKARVDDLFSIVIKGDVKFASYMPAGNEPLAPGNSLTLSFNVHAAGELSPIGATLAGWGEGDELTFLAKHHIYIYTADELFALADRVNDGDDCKDVVVNLMEDIDLAGKFWTPIGVDATPFAGFFLGNGHVIENFEVKAVADRGGLFGMTNTGSRIEHLTVKNAVIDSKNFAGAIAAGNNGTIEGCTVINTEIWGDYSGGVVGTNNGIIAACRYDGKVTGFSYFGGLVGGNHGTLVASISLGRVSMMGNFGAIAGYSIASTTYCLWKKQSDWANNALGNTAVTPEGCKSLESFTTADLAPLNTQLAARNSLFRWELDGAGTPVITKIDANTP